MADEKDIYWGKDGTSKTHAFVDAMAGQANGVRFDTVNAALDAAKYDAGMRLDIAGKRTTLSGIYSSALWIGEGVREQVKSYSMGVAFVKVPGVGGVPVYLENKIIGKTNKEASLLIGPMRNLEANAVRIDERMLPIGYEVESSEYAAVLNGGHVALVEYKRRSISALLVRLTHAGMDVEIGQSLKGTDTIVVYHGEVDFEDPTADQTCDVEGVCSFTLPDALPAFSDATPVIECN